MRAGTTFPKPPNGNITDWYGILLDPKIRSRFRVGNVVRICGDCYVRIQKICRNPMWLVGIVEDPYIDSWSWHANREKITFSMFKDTKL